MFPVGNNLNRGHIYFQDFWKSFRILSKAKQLQFNRKQKQKSKKEREESPPGPYLCWPSHLARPSLLALQVVVLLAPEGRGARGRRPRPHAGHLLLLPTHGDVQRCHATPTSPLILSRDGRARPSLPIAVVATTTIPSPLRRAH